MIEFSDRNVKIINFQNELNEIFQKLRDNHQELIRDLKGYYLIDIQKDHKKNQNKF